MKAGSKRKRLLRRVDYLQNFSLEVVTGALAMALFAVKWSHAVLPQAWWLILALAVWIIYTTDHLMDGMKKKEEAMIVRHRIHYRFRTPLTAIVLILSIITLLLSYKYLTRETLTGGVVLSALALLYLLMIALIHSREKYFLKEFFIAIIYVFGIWLAPLMEGNDIPPIETAVLLTGFVLLVFSEGVLVSLNEAALDQKDSQPSFALVFGEYSTEIILKSLLWTLFLNAVVWAFLNRSTNYGAGFLLQAFMALILYVMLKQKAAFASRQTFRLTGELVFWLPALYWWIQ